MAEQQPGPGEKQPIGYNESSRDGGTTDGQTEQVSSGQVGGVDNVEQDLYSSEGEPGRAQSETTRGQDVAETSDVPDPAESDSRI